MERPQNVGKLGLLERLNKVLAVYVRDEIKSAEAPAFFRRDVGELTQSDKQGALCASDGHIGDYQGPLPGAQLSEEHLYIWHDTHTPALGIEDLLQRALTLSIVIQDEDADLPGLDWGRRGTHFQSIASALAGWSEKAGGGGVSANRG